MLPVYPSKCSVSLDSSSVRGPVKRALPYVAITVEDKGNCGKYRGCRCNFRNLLKKAADFFWLNRIGKITISCFAYNSFSLYMFHTILLHSVLYVVQCTGTKIVMRNCVGKQSPHRPYDITV